jgi:hypothetical protein
LAGARLSFVRVASLPVSQKKQHSMHFVRAHAPRILFVFCSACSCASKSYSKPSPQTNQNKKQGKVGNKWSEVAKHIPGRTGQQCAQRWRHKVNPNIRRDKWGDDEDARLVDLVRTFGIGKWAEIARHMVGRTDQQCMGRWRRHLDPNIRRVRERRVGVCVLL